MKNAYRTTAAALGSVALTVGGCVAWVNMSPSMQIASAIFAAGFMIAAAITLREPASVTINVDGAALRKAGGNANG